MGKVGEFFRKVFGIGNKDNGVETCGVGATTCRGEGRNWFGNSDDIERSSSFYGGEFEDEIDEYILIDEEYDDFDDDIY